MIIAILIDKNSFEKKMKLFQPIPILELPDFREAGIGDLADLKGGVNVCEKRWRFQRVYQLGKRTFLYKQI